MPTGNSSIDAAVAGIATARQRKEDNYIDQRRAVVDPLKDKDLYRTDVARDSLVDQYGAQAGDPTQTSGVLTNQYAQQTLPDRVQQPALQNEQAKVQTATAQNTLGNAIQAEHVDGMKRLTQAGINAMSKGQKFSDFMASVPANVKADLGLDPEQEAGMISAIADDPKKITAFARALADPAGIQTILTGKNTATGQRGAYAVAKDTPEGFIDGFQPDEKYNPNTGGFTLGGAIRYGPRGQVIADATDELANYKADTAGQTVSAKDRAEAVIALPGTESRTKLILGDIDRLIANPGLKDITGLPGLEKAFQGGPGGLTDYMAKNRVFPGTPAADAMSQLKHIADQARVQGISFYDGKGSLSNAEGEAAAQAIINLATSGTYDEVQRNLKVGRQAQLDNLDIQRQRAGRQPAASAPAVAPAGKKKYTYNPATGELE